jgi:hypothetical protein
MGALSGDGGKENTFLLQIFCWISSFFKKQEEGEEGLSPYVKFQRFKNIFIIKVLILVFRNV